MSDDRDQFTPQPAVQLPARTPHFDYDTALAVTGYEAVAAEVLAEAQRARMKFPPFNSAHEGYAVLAEEVDELWDDVKADRLEASIAEAVQVGAMAIRYIADMRGKL